MINQGFIIITIIVFCAGVIIGVQSQPEKNDVRQALLIDIKERCKPVLKTIIRNNVTTLYTCPDDTQYEFTERL